MASAYSIVRQYRDYIQPFNFQLLQAGLERKQQTFDYNLDKLQTEIDEFANIDLVKKEDKKYLRERLETVLNGVNSFGSMDLSSNSVTRNISSMIGQSIDDTVIDAYQSTKNFRNLQSEINDVKKNRPKLYNQINEAYSMRGAREWLNDGQTGSEYSGGSYTPYTDVQGNLDKKIGELRKNKGEQAMTVRELDVDGKPTGYMVTKKVKELTAEEIRTVVSNSMNPLDKKQLEINGWYNFSQVSDAEARSYLGTYSGERTKLLDAEIANQRLQLGKTDNEDSKTAITENIKYLTRQKNNFQTKISSIAPTSESIGTFLEEQRVVNGLVSTHQFKEISVDYKTDQAFWKRLNYNYNVQKDARDFEYKRLKDIEDHKLAVAKVNQKSKSASGGDAFAGLSVNSVKVQEDEFVQPKTEFDYVEETEKNSVIYQNKVLDLIKNQDEATRNNFNTLYEGAKADERNKGKSEKEIKAELFSNLYEYGKNTKFKYRDGELDSLIKLEEAIETNKIILDKAHVGLEGISEEEWKKSFDLAKKHGLLPKSGDGTTPDSTSSITYDELKQDPDKLNEFKAKILTDFLLTGSNNIYGMERGDNPSRMKQRATVKGKVGTKESGKEWKAELFKYNHYLKNIGEVLGEEVRVEDIFDIVETTDTRGGDINRTVVNVAYPKLKTESTTAPKTLAFIANAFKNKEFDTSTNLFGGDSFQDFGSQRELFGYESQREQLKNNLNDFQQNQPDFKNVTFSKSSPFYEVLASAFAGGGMSVAGNPTEFALTPNQPLTVRKDIKGGRYMISQNNGKDERRTSYVTEESLLQFVGKDGVTQLGQVLELETTNNSNFIRTAPPIKTKASSFVDSDVSYNYFETVIKPTYRDNIAEIDWVEKESARELLLSKYAAHVTDEAGEDTDYANLIDAVIEDPSKFSVVSEKGVNDNTGVIRVTYEDAIGEERNIFVSQMDAVNYKRERDFVKKTPERFVFNALNSILATQTQYEMSYGGKKEYSKFKELKKLYLNAE